MCWHWRVVAEGKAVPRKQHQGQRKGPHGQYEVLWTKPTSSQENATCSLQKVASGWAEPRINPCPEADRLSPAPLSSSLGIYWLGFSLRMSLSILDVEHCF